MDPKAVPSGLDHTVASPLLINAVHVHDLLAREQIRHLVASYARAVDRLDWALLRSCYHPDAVDDHGVVCGTIDALVEHFSATLPTFDSTFHSIGNVTMDTSGTHRGEVTAETYCIARHHYANASGPMVLRTGVRYLDRFTDRGAGYLIEHRGVVLDWVQNSAAADRWAYSSQFRRGARPGTDAPDPSDGFLPNGPAPSIPHPHNTHRKASHDD